MLGSQGLINVSIALDMPWAIDRKTCRLVSNYNVDLMLLMNCSEQTCPRILQKSTERIWGKCH